jgi:hypothetical protein
MKRFVLSALVPVLLCAPARGQTTKIEDVMYVRGLQTEAGGFLPAARLKPPTLRATSAAVRTLKYLGGEVPDPQAAAKFVASCFDADSGGFADTPGGKPDVPTTAVGLMAVVALKMPVEKYAGPAVEYLTANARAFEEIRIAAAGLEALGKTTPKNEAWVEAVKAKRGPDGLYGKGDGVARDTASAEVALLRLGAKRDDRKALLAALVAGQRPDGGWGKEGAKGSDLESTYRVMRAFHMLKEKPPREADLRRFLDGFRADGGGYATVRGEPASASGTYYVAIIRHWLGDR